MPSLHIEHLENFITEVVDDFDGDFACRGSHVRPAGGAVKGRPSRRINLGPQRPLGFFVRLICTLCRLSPSVLNVMPYLSVEDQAQRLDVLHRPLERPGRS
jgi:hypothetical protein